ncbi:condensation domain-containing protein [Dactylosporangium sp. NPDC050688]|uniref:condensation domain-containing protein n=1 Tax=Dactylosporangium sp. NPDC050688 TaxID=3157217 RepID=UPI003402ACA1
MSWAQHRRRRAVEAGLPPLVRTSRGPDHPVTPAQHRLWLLDQAGPRIAYNITLSRRLRGPIDLVALRHATRVVSRRHEALRTTFAEAGGQVRQRLHADLPPEVVLREPPPGGPPFTEADIRRMVDAEATRPMCLRTGPLLRLWLVRCAPTEHVLVLSVHHIVADGWSLRVIAAELAAVYRARVDGDEAGLPPVDLHLVDVVDWRRSWLRGEHLQRYLDFADRSGVLRAVASPPLPPTRSDPVAGTGVRHGFDVAPGVADRLRRYAADLGLTLFTVMLAAYALLLTRHGGGRDLLIGSPAANRSRPELARVVGYLVTIMPLRLVMDADERVADLLTRVGAAVTDAFAHQAATIEDLLTAADPHTDLRTAYPITALFALHSFHRGDTVLAATTDEPYPIHAKDTEFPLALSILDGGPELHGYLGYDPRQYDAALADRLVTDYRSILTAMAAADPDARTAALLTARDDPGRP